MRSFDVDFLSMGQAANLYFQNVKPEKTRTGSEIFQACKSAAGKPEY